MPTENYNGTDVTHIVATTDRTQAGITIENGKLYGIDHFYDVSLNWWVVALNNGWARIAVEDDFPDPTFAYNRLRKHRRFNKRRYIIIDTPEVTKLQLERFIKSPSVKLDGLRFNQRANGTTDLLGVAVVNKRDEQDRLVFNFNGNDIVVENQTSIRTVNGRKEHTHYQFLQIVNSVEAFEIGDIPLDEISITVSNGTVTGTQTRAWRNEA
jgi:hypothetical protein